MPSRSFPYVLYCLLLRAWLSRGAASTPRSEETRTQSQPAKVLFVVGPSSVAERMHAERMRAIAETWGQGQQVVEISNRHDGMEQLEVWASEHPFSKLSQLAKSTSNIPTWHFNASSALHSEATWQALLKRAVEERSWDWLIRLDDLAIIIPPNLQEMLSHFDPTLPILLGSKLKIPGSNNIYFSSAAGVIMSRAAVEAFLKSPCPVQNGWLKEKNYDIHMHTCMVRHLGAKAESPRDPDGGYKINAYSPVASYLNRYDDWYVKYKAAAGETIASGPSCCSLYPVTFHYVEADEQRKIYSLMMEREKWKAMSPVERQNAWHVENICMYSKRIDSASNPVWEFLMSKMQVHKT